MTYDYDIADPTEHQPRIAVLLAAIPTATEQDATHMSDELTDLLIASGTMPAEIDAAMAAALSRPPNV